MILCAHYFISIKHIIQMERKTRQIEIYDMPGISGVTLRTSTSGEQILDIHGAEEFPLELSLNLPVRRQPRNKQEEATFLRQIITIAQYAAMALCTNWESASTLVEGLPASIQELSQSQVSPVPYNKSCTSLQEALMQLENFSQEFDGINLAQVHIAGHLILVPLSSHKTLTPQSLYEFLYSHLELTIREYFIDEELNQIILTVMKQTYEHLLRN